MDKCLDSDLSMDSGIDMGTSKGIDFDMGLSKNAGLGMGRNMGVGLSITLEQSDNIMFNLYSGKSCQGVTSHSKGAVQRCPGLVKVRAWDWA